MTAPPSLRTAGAVLVAGALALFGIGIVAAPSALAAPTLTLSSSSVTAGQTITVKGSGLPKAPTSLYITICANPPGATNCDVDLSHVTQLQYDGSGSFSTKYKIAVTKFASADGQINCANTQCVVGSTNALNPKDRSYNAVGKFSVGGSTTPTKSATPTSTSSTSTASATSTPSSAPTLPKTGGSDSTPLVAAAAVAALAGGGVLFLIGGARRRRQH